MLRDAWKAHLGSIQGLGAGISLLLASELTPSILYPLWFQEYSNPGPSKMQTSFFPSFSQTPHETLAVTDRTLGAAPKN